METTLESIDRRLATIEDLILKQVGSVLERLMEKAEAKMDKTVSVPEPSSSPPPEIGHVDPGNTWGGQDVDPEPVGGKTREEYLTDSPGEIWPPPNSDVMGAF